MLSDVPIGKLYVRDMTDIATGARVHNVYMGANLADLEALPSPRRPPPPPPLSRLERLERLLRHPVKTTKNGLARRLGRVAAN